LENFALELEIAVLFGISLTQFGLLAHAAIHGQMFKSKMANQIAGHVCGCGIGFSPSWWRCKHNEDHHRRPNIEELDGDIKVIVIAFTPKQALEKTRWQRWAVKRQKGAFLWILCLAAISMWLASLAHLISPKRQRKDAVLEWTLFSLHTICYIALIWFFVDSWWQQILFVLINKSVQGFYMGMVFATNHKAMPILTEKDSKNLGFLLQQVLPSRSIRVPKIFQGLFAGLNYQIEHHLFPDVPESALRGIQTIVIPFCEEKGITYALTGFWKSIRDIRTHLGNVALLLREYDKLAVRV
ncbi:acyl-CoA desaturase, partial [Patescibacteria group bacterium]|nr:acyl-CoA desaturase [Patescibacteria group bacterium]